MARKETITRDILINTAFELLQQEGIEQVTARKLAAKAGCSTQPIFRLYKNMEELQAELYEKMILFFEAYYMQFPVKEDTPFVNLGLAYIHFAEIEKNLFKALFLSSERGGKSLYELLNGTSGSVVKEINKAKALGSSNASELFMKMWIFIHGAACMVITGDYDLSESETMELLKDSYLAYTRK
ncbi:MAG: TetR/AcrR family transcriptional regulator [Lachnospiraceae bacterium]|nr:TetR/AcrR family transcriptional regulator [Lachnospiraceae bacterium]